MKKLLVFIFCSLYTFVLLAQNRITTDTVGMLHMGAGNITLLELDTINRSERSPVVIRRDTTAFEMIYIDSLLPAPVGKPQVLSASLSAGRTEAILDVSASGGATYTVPFALPPGINGVMPQLGLAYNSQGGTGMAGYGWNIYGLSSITRIGAAKYSDGKIGGINLDTTDRFALDGQRLLLKSGIYGDDGAEYQTEQYSNIRIISKGISPIGTEYTPEYFEVYYPDGSFALYGVREIDGYNNPFSEMEYALNYIENPQGIRIAYTYSIHGNQLYVTKVRYGSRGETAGINEVQFEYTTKNRAELRYVGGARLESNRLLSKVSVIANGIPYRHYLPSYDSVATLGYDRMIKIQELDGSENHAFEPILFGYETTDNLVTTSTIPDLSPPGIASNNYYVVTADFTGNGTMDFLLCPHTKDKFYFFYDIEAGTPFPPWATPINTGLYREIFPATWLTHNDKVPPGQGMALARDDGINKYKFDVYAWTAYSHVLYQYTKNFHAPALPEYYSYCDDSFHSNGPMTFEFVSGDFNGDGLTDIMAISRSETIVMEEYPTSGGGCQKQYELSESGVIYIDMRETGYNYELWCEPFYFNDGDKLYAADFDGDGRTDILIVKNNLMSVYSMREDDGFFAERWSVYDGKVKTNEKIILGDYNGDGKMDVMFSTGYNDVFATFISTGAYFVKHEQTQPFSNVQNSSSGGTLQQHVLIPSDVNGDGKTDIIYTRTTTYDSTPNGNIYTVIHHNTGVNSSSAPVFGASASKTEDTRVRHNPIPLFLNPDRQNPDLEFGFVSDNTITLFKSHKNMQREALLTTIEQDGVTHEVEYARLMPDDYYAYDVPLYESSYEQTFPYIDIHYAPSTRVVPRITRTAVGHTVQQVFGYREAVTNADGLGFVGFRGLTRSNWHVDMLDSNRTFTISVQSPQLRGANLRTFTSKWDYLEPVIREMALTDPPPVGGIPDEAILKWDYISRQDVAYRTDTLPNRTFVNIPIATSTKDLLSGTYHNRQMWYDSLYNPVYITEDINNEANKRTGMSYVNNTDTTEYYVGRLLSRQDTLEHASDIYTTEEQYTYMGYLPTEVKRKGHGTDFVVDSLSYDVFGNVVERKTTVPGATQRVETMQYDVSGRFMTQHTDPDNLVTTYTHYPDIGRVHTETDPYSRSTTYSYDSWARVTDWTDYLGNTGTRGYTISGVGGVRIDENLPTGENSSIYINALGQKTEEQDNTVLGTVVGRGWQYDVYGRQVGVSQIGEPDYYDEWDSVCFDQYGRVNQEISYTGRIKNYAYDSLTTTVNDGIKSMTTIRNALGQIVSVQDPGGTVTYSYYANGNLKETDYGGSIQAIEQDGWGRKTKLTDPSAGVYTYSYDGWGQITQETTPKGSTTYGYDSVGKLLSKSLTGDSTDMQWTYSYDPVSKLPVQTQLLNADGNNSTYSYTYDGWSRPDSLIEDNVNALFKKSYTYNAMGLPDTVSISAREKTSGYEAIQRWKYHYQYGELQKITLGTNGQAIWQVNSLDVKGRLTVVSQGTNQRTDFGYDSYGYPFLQILQRHTPSTSLMTLGTTFDAPRGFPTARSNSVFGWNETFGYDNMDRLTTFDDNNGSHSQQYDARGRITENSLLGEYSYLGNSYQQHELELNPTAGLYYQSRSPQQISFNAFKKPVEIHEAGHDRVSFQYNGALQRSHSYYGSEAIDPLDRPYRRYYSQDGSVEITRDMLTDTTSFVFYLGGDAYSAPAIWKVVQDSASTDAQLYYLHRDYLGSILLITDSIGGIVEQRQFDAWGNIVKLTDGSSNPLDKFVILDRGYTGHEHLFGVALINMNGRLYDARLHRFLSPDNYVQDALNTQNFNRYGYAMNNPLVYVDQNGEFLWFVPIIVGAVVGAYLGGSAANNNFNPFKWDYGSWSTWRGMATGAVIGGISGASWSFGLAALNGSALVGGHTVVSGLSVSGLTKVAAWTVLGSKAISTATTVASMISDFDNAARIWAGKYYSDDNISFGGQLMQGLSRSTWEILQSWGGYNYSQIRNIAGDVDRVDYLGGATFVTNEGAAGGAWGVSLGNYLNLNINGGIIGSFSEWVTNNPLYMHEYGHTFDSRGYGPAYLFKVGIPSARSAKRSTQISGEPQGVETHDFQWYEMNANRYAARYFGRYYGVNWNRPFGLPGDTIETYYPRRTRIRTRR